MTAGKGGAVTDEKANVIALVMVSLALIITGLVANTIADQRDDARLELAACRDSLAVERADLIECYMRADSLRLAPERPR